MFTTSINCIYTEKNGPVHCLSWKTFKLILTFQKDNSHFVLEISRCRIQTYTSSSSKNFVRSKYISNFQLKQSSFYHNRLFQQYWCIIHTECTTYAAFTYRKFKRSICYGHVNLSEYVCE